MSPEKPSARERLAFQQAALVRSLKTGAMPPEGFDLPNLQVATASLLNKRARSARKGWPELSASLGERFLKLFEEYAHTVPAPREPGANIDGRSFARWLKSRRLLPDAGHIELAVDNVCHGFPIRIVLLRKPRRLGIVFRTSRRGAHIVRIGPVV